MTRKSIEVAVHILDINLEMRRCLCSVDKHGHTVAMSNGYHLLDRIDGSQHIGHMGDGDKTGIVAEQVLIGLHIHLIAVIDGHDTQHHALALTDELPRHDVAVMFHHGNDNLVAVLKHLSEG